MTTCWYIQLTLEALVQIDVIHVMSTRVLWILHQPRRRWPNPRGSVSPKSTGRDFFLTLLSEYSSSVDMHVDIFYLFYLIAFCMASQLIYPITSYFLLDDSDLCDPESMSFDGRSPASMWNRRKKTHQGACYTNFGLGMVQSNVTIRSITIRINYIFKKFDRIQPHEIWWDCDSDCLIGEFCANQPSTAKPSGGQFRSWSWEPWTSSTFYRG